MKRAVEAVALVLLASPLTGCLVAVVDTRGNKLAAVAAATGPVMACALALILGIWALLIARGSRP